MRDVDVLVDRLTVRSILVKLVESFILLFPGMRRTRHVAFAAAVVQIAQATLPALIREVLVPVIGEQRVGVLVLLMQIRPGHEATLAVTILEIIAEIVI